MNVRKLALDTLSKCESAAQYANLALDARIKKYNISGDDRSLFTVLVYGTIEHKLTLDYYIGLLSDLPESKIDAQTRNILRLGLYQIIYMRTRDHAAVNETVALAPQKTRGFVNAILRSYIRRKDTLPLPDKSEDLAHYLSVNYSFPKATCEKLL
jgi:16S rRNA (cytosine967-C5)-methyltransferase